MNYQFLHLCTGQKTKDFPELDSGHVTAKGDFFKRQISKASVPSPELIPKSAVPKKPKTAKKFIKLEDDLPESVNFMLDYLERTKSEQGQLGPRKKSCDHEESDWRKNKEWVQQLGLRRTKTTDISSIVSMINFFIPSVKLRLFTFLC